MYSNIKNIFFDMGNTLIDFHQGISDAEKDLLGLKLMSECIEKFSGHHISTKELQTDFFEPWDKFITPNRKYNLQEYPVEMFLNPLLDKYKISLTRQQLIEVMDCQHTYYRHNLSIDDDLIEVLLYLKKKSFQLGVISNCYIFDEVYLRHFASVGIKQYFDSFSFSYGLVHRKPKVEIFVHALRSLSAKPHESIMIGDSLSADILGAQNIGMKALWYNKKGKPSDDAISPDGIICSFDELTKLF